MAFGSPSHNEIPKYVFGMPLNILGNPLWGTEPTLLPTWQQTYAPSTPYNAVAAHAPSHFTALVSSTTGIFQYNSTPPPPKSQTRNSWIPLGSQMGGGNQEYSIMSRRIIAVSRTPNTRPISESLGKNLAKTDPSLLARQLSII